MRDEADLRRLAEMGIDAYAPRTGDAPTRVAASAAGSVAAPNGANVVLLADGSTPHANVLLAAVTRALAFARVACTQADTADERVLAGAAALVAFGDKHARAAGAAMSAQRQGEVAWVVTAEPALLATDPHGKRALWSELKRIAGQLSRTNGA
ncbi:hypothetical protein [Dokdonella sp.]|uniref:hypothetical protein n=1 Tax=Dokdonella sp. TaxID=2291710 RepID=UPI003783D605